jgi:ribosomal subunit interface protein
MEIVVKGRNVDVPEHFRVHVDERLARLQRYDRKGLSLDVELLHEPNRRQQKSCQRVEITGKGKGPVVRSEACAGDFYAALDYAAHKIEKRLRREHDRRKVHHGRHSPAPVSVATAGRLPRAVPALAEVDGNNSGALITTAGRDAAGSEPRRGEDAAFPADAADAADADVPRQRVAGTGARTDPGGTSHEPGRVVREKEHAARPMSVDDALYEMELVGHDFYLFCDAGTRKPSVVYRRKGFDYGVITLAMTA